MNIASPHTFHIPVMGLGFTVDTPVKVAKYGISSVVSVIEDQLLERMREVICNKEKLEFIPISIHEEDSKAKRITAYLNTMHDVVQLQIERIKKEDFSIDHDINYYFQLLADDSELKKMYDSLEQCNAVERKEMEDALRNFIVPGSIDVNIMTKVDKTNFDKNGNELPPEYSDALACLRGYANSKLESSIIFSAGLNPRLYSYCEKFDDFFPDGNGVIKKEVILKVSDYRSALIQGKFLAKKGIWVSEFRIESGINCGGHAFIANGILLGPILEDFKTKRQELYNELFTECNKAIHASGRLSFQLNPIQRITAQGGLGTAEESELLLKHYDIDSTGWGSPFLLVPEVTNVDQDTLQKLVNAKQDDYYLSDASPLGVLFNNLRDSSSELQRKERIAKNRPGSPCYKKYLAFNKEYTEMPICTASRQYQKLKIDDLKSTIHDQVILDEEIAKLEEKDCLCEGLGVAALLKNDAQVVHNLTAVTICPGPNLAYFSGVFSLKQMADHIYGRLNLLNKIPRPNFFVNELELYVKYIQSEFEKSMSELTTKKENYFKTFRQNLEEGIAYYENLFSEIKHANKDVQALSMKRLNEIKSALPSILPSRESIAV